MHARHAEHEIVELLIDVGRWPAGTVGTVVDANDTTVLVEIADDRGHGLDFLSVPRTALAAADSGVSQASR